MIHLDNVSKYYGRGSKAKCVLNDVNRIFPMDKSIGVLGLNGSGKSTLLRIIAGTMLPTYGKVRRSISVSWPLGLDGFKGSLTGEENLRFVSRIYGVDRRAVFNFVADFTELGSDLFLPVKTYSSGMRARLSLALSLAIHFDVYLVDEGLSVGDMRFEERYRAAITSRFQESRVIIVSHHMSTVRRYCSQATILHNGRVSEILPLRLAAEVYERLAVRAPEPNYEQ